VTGGSESLPSKSDGIRLYGIGLGRHSVSRLPGSVQDANTRSNNNNNNSTAIQSILCSISTSTTTI
jgi:hypothetical protein